MLKDLQKSSEEKLATSLERIGELRSSLLEKDRMIREALVSFKRIGEIVYELEPQKLVEERKRFESELLLLKSKLSEYEEIIRNLLREFREIRDIFAKLRNMEMLISIAKEVGGKLVKISEIESTVERYLHKIESLYSDIELKVGELPLFMDKVKKLDSLTLEIVKSLDEMKVKLRQFATTSDLEGLRNELKELWDKLEKIKLEVAERRITLKEEEELKKVLASVNEELESLNTTLKLVEEQYRDALISEKVYEEIVKKGKERLDVLNEVKKSICEILERGRTREGEIRYLIERLKTLHS